MKTLRTPDATWLALRQEPNFRPFFEGLLEYLKKKLEKVKKAGAYDYYTCGHEHYSWDRHWEPFKHLWNYCEKTGYDFYEAKDLIEERIGRKIICECQLLNDDKAVRKKELEVVFGVDFGEPGKREVDVV